jgi:hypothetical protein
MAILARLEKIWPKSSESPKNRPKPSKEGTNPPEGTYFACLTPRYDIINDCNV